MNDTPPKRAPQRLALIKTERMAGIGAELLTLCEAVTADGVVTEEESRQLAGWLEANQDSDLPAIRYLAPIVAHILEDGKVTPSERRELYQAIERILPIDVRRAAKDRRRAVEASEFAAAHIERVREDLARPRPIRREDFMVAGVYFDGRGDVIEAHANAGDTVHLVRDPANPYSKNAIEVRLTNRRQIGFVPEVLAVELAPVMDGGCQERATIKKILTGGRVPIPVIVADFYPQGADIPAAVVPAQSQAQGGGCITCLTIVGVGVLALAILLALIMRS